MAQFKAGNGRLEIRLSGSGGQGVITAGVILAEAAILDGKNAVQSQSYGPESRGGYSKCEVILSDGEIDYPKVSSPDVLLALTEEALAHYGKTVKTEGLLIADESIGEPGGLQEGVRVLRVPILQTAREKVGREITANVVALGVLAVITEAVSRPALQEAVLARVPKGTTELNIKALSCGFELAEA